MQIRKTFRTFATPIKRTPLAKYGSIKRLFGTEFNKDLLMSFLNASLRQDDEIAKLSSTELKQYEDSINAYRDIQNALNTAKKESFEEGHEIGLAKGRLQEKKAIALILKQSGTSIEVIAQATRPSGRRD